MLFPRVVFLAAALVQPGWATEVPSCATIGRGYTDAYVSTPNGGAPANALDCQKACEINPFCSYFTYYNNSNACWLLGEKATLMVSPDPKATSGPKVCPADGIGSEAAGMAENTKEALQGVADSTQGDLASLKTYTDNLPLSPEAQTALKSQVSAQAAKQLTEAKNDLSNTTKKDMVAAKEEAVNGSDLLLGTAASSEATPDNGGGIPWWSVVAGGLVAAGLAVGGGYAYNQHSKNEAMAKKQRGRGVKIEDDSSSQSEEVEAPLVADRGAEAAAVATSSVLAGAMPPQYIPALPQQFTYVPRAAYPQYPQAAAPQVVSTVVQPVQELVLPAQGVASATPPLGEPGAAVP